MKTSREMVNSILKTSQMGIAELNSIMKASLQLGMRQELSQQLQTLSRIEQQAQALAHSRGWSLAPMDPMAIRMAAAMSRARMKFGQPDSRAAAMVVRGNTKGIIKGFHNLNHYRKSDGRICVLAQMLLDCEAEGIRQMQPFL